MIERKSAVNSFMRGNKFNGEMGEAVRNHIVAQDAVIKDLTIEFKNYVKQQDILVRQLQRENSRLAAGQCVNCIGERNDRI